MSTCQDCGHPWSAHDDRRHGCRHTAFGHKCACGNVDPRIVEEDRRAGALWRFFTGASDAS